VLPSLSRTRIALPFIALLITLAFSPTLALADAKEKVAALAPSGLVLVLDADGKELVAQNADVPFVPASVTKIVTAWLAMEVLGADHRFQTSFYLDKARVLHVRGGGDPFLVSEELALLAPKLVAAVGTKPLTGIVVDTSYQPTSLRIPGVEESARSYDALNTALAVNFNTIQAVRRGNKVEAGEPQTPLTPLAISQFRARGPKSGKGRISLGQDPALSVQYAGELLAAFAMKAASNSPAYCTLAEILTDMLRGSNNYIANQVFLEIGGKRLGGPLSLEKSLKVAREILAKHDLAGAIQLVEGSGISHDNRFTARGLAKVLDLFAPHAALLVSSKDAAYKTGTLEGVRTLAGYANTSSHGRVRFVISLKSNDGTLRFKLLQAIASEL